MNYKMRMLPISLCRFKKGKIANKLQIRTESLLELSSFPYFVEFEHYGQFEASIVTRFRVLFDSGFTYAGMCNGRPLIQNRIRLS